MRIFDAAGRWLRLSSKNEPQQAPAVSYEELSLAWSICKKAPGALSADYVWRTDRWLEVIDHFGQDKAEVMGEMLEKMNTAFWSIESDPHGVTVVEEAMAVSKVFRAEFPSAPPEWVRYFEGQFMMRNR